jgi:hypothetical protein
LHVGGRIAGEPHHRFPHHPTPNFYVWGRFLCALWIEGGRMVPEGDTSAVRPGDVIQFQGVLFERRTGNGHGRWVYEHHTAVVRGVSPDGSTVAIWHQNVNGRQTVGPDEIYLPYMTRGHLRVYGRDGTLVIADASEDPQGEPLYVKLVENGRIVYRESF